jgi:hypothetical protein
MGRRDRAKQNRSIAKSIAQTSSYDCFVTLKPRASRLTRRIVFVASTGPNLKFKGTM